MRVWDIRQAIQAAHYVTETGDAQMELRASGEMAVNALYAALFELNLTRIELTRLPASHMIGPDYFNVLKIWDISQAVATERDRAEVILR